VANHVLAHSPLPASTTGSSTGRAPELTISELRTNGQLPGCNGEVRGPTEYAGNGARTRLNGGQRLRGKRAAVVLFSHYPSDPRPRRAAEALTMEGVEIDLICLQESRQQPAQEIVNGIKVYRVPMKRKRAGKGHYVAQYSAFILMSFAYLALRSVRRRYDFVHVHNMPDVLVFSALIPKALGAKVILDLHDPMPELMQTIFGLHESSRGIRLLKRLERLSIGFADLAITVNAACKRIYSSRSCRPDKITVIMNSPDDSIFCFQAPPSNGCRRDEPDQSFTILYHGSLVPRNGFDLAVDALEIIKDRIPKAQLVVCGERNSFFNEVMASVEKRGLEKRVRYLGIKNQRGIADTIRSCDLGVIPNHRNTFTEINTPTRIFEYLSLGKPVVAPRTRGIEDYFGNDDLLFFEAGDAKDLARRIEFAYFNPEKLTNIVEQGQKVYLANSWSRQKSNLLHAVDQLWPS
jgi:glycosyltransferase involved in cell wall biosynthesis